MNAELTRRSIEVQQKLLDRLLQLGYADSVSAESLSRDLANAAVVGQALAETTLPLFLNLNMEHQSSLAQVVFSMSAEIDELSDALLDLRSNLRDLVDFVSSRS